MSIQKATERSSNLRSDSSSERVLSILDLFQESQPVWTTDQLTAKLGVAKATLYRYLRSLVDAGFLSPDGSGTYSLGPRFIEMDRQIRLTDPLLQIAPTVIRSLRPEFSGDILISRYYGTRVLSIYEDRVDPKIKQITTIDRGRPFPLFLGAPSKIIVANLSQKKLQRLFLHNPQEIADAGLGKNWIEFKEKLRLINKDGYSIASDIDKELVGIAAPIFLPSGEITGSLCLVRVRADVNERDLKEIAKLTCKTATEITKRLQEHLSAITK